MPSSINIQMEPKYQSIIDIDPIIGDNFECTWKKWRYSTFVQNPEENIYLAVGYGQSNAAMIEGSDGLIIVDADES